MTASPSSTASLFTMGHSNLELDNYLTIISTHDVNMVCDVRSRPASSRFPQFNREPFEECLRAAGLGYAFFGGELGGRPEDPRAYFADGRVNYEQRRKARDFQAGIDRVIALNQTSTIVLMCAEEDPLQCHRFLMICPALGERGISPLHIRREGKLETQLAAEDRLLKLHDLSGFASDALFSGEREQALQDALRRQAKDFAFQISPGTLEEF